MHTKKLIIIAITFGLLAITAISTRAATQQFLKPAMGTQQTLQIKKISPTQTTVKPLVRTAEPLTAIDNVMVINPILQPTTPLAPVDTTLPIDVVTDPTVNDPEKACEGVEEIVASEKDVEAKVEILNKYNQEPYKSKYMSGDIYCLKYNMNVPYKPNKPLTFTILDDHDVYISGLNLRSGLTDSTTPLFKVINNRQNIVHIAKATLTDVKSGISIEGSGQVNVKDTTITGDASKSGRCLTISSPKALISGSRVSSCKQGIHITNGATGTIIENGTTITNNSEDGVYVDADDVKIRASSVTDNGRGVHVASDRTGTDVTGTVVCKNGKTRFDGIALDGDTERKWDIGFYGKKDGQFSLKNPDPETGVYKYDPGEEVVVGLPDGSRPYVGSEVGGMEFFRAIPEDPANQGCEITENSISTSQTNLEKSHSLKSERNKPFVTIYTDTERGSTFISEQFYNSDCLTEEGCIITFVTTGLDIPTQPTGRTEQQSTSGSFIVDSQGPGARVPVAPDAPTQDNEDDETIGTSSGSGMDGGDGAVEHPVLVDPASLLTGGEVASGGGASGGIGFKKAGCSLVAGDTNPTVGWWAGLWWVVFGVTLMGALRIVIHNKGLYTWIREKIDLQ